MKSIGVKLYGITYIFSDNCCTIYKDALHHFCDEYKVISFLPNWVDIDDYNKARDMAFDLLKKEEKC